MNLEVSLIKNWSTLLTILFISLLFGSCCDHDEPTLSEVKICSEHVDDLDKAECDDNMTSLALSSDAITASALVHANEADTEITFRLIETTTGTDILVGEKIQTIRDADEDVEGKCAIWAAVSWTTSNGQDWPEADLKVEVELNTAAPQILTKTFSLK